MKHVSLFFEKTLKTWFYNKWVSGASASVRLTPLSNTITHAIILYHRLRRPCFVFCLIHICKTGRKETSLQSNSHWKWHACNFKKNLWLKIEKRPKYHWGLLSGLTGPIMSLQNKFFGSNLKHYCFKAPSGGNGWVLSYRQKTKF